MSGLECGWRNSGDLPYGEAFVSATGCFDISMLKIALYAYSNGMTCRTCDLLMAGARAHRLTSPAAQLFQQQGVIESNRENRRHGAPILRGASRGVARWQSDEPCRRAPFTAAED
jgi:hypothetical protein